MDPTDSPAPSSGITTASPARPGAARSDRVPPLAWLIASLFVALELAFSSRYGFLQDELYFIEAGHHLAFGYVDQPPLAPLLTRITSIAGVSPTAVRIVPALAGGIMVAAAAKFAALFGAGRPGRVLAALATACAPVILGAPHRPHRRAQANHAQRALAGITGDREDFSHREDFSRA